MYERLADVLAFRIEQTGGEAVWPERQLGSHQRNLHVGRGLRGIEVDVGGRARNVGVHRQLIVQAGAKRRGRGGGSGGWTTAA